MAISFSQVNVISFKILPMPSKQNDGSHQEDVEQVNWQEVFPFECKDLVDTKAWESPFEPHDQENDAEHFQKEPNKSRNEIHYIVKSGPVSEMEWHPASKENYCSHGRN